MGALVKDMTFLLHALDSARQRIRALRASCSLREWTAPYFGLFCSAIPCPAVPGSGIFSHCYHFSPLSGSDISFRSPSLFSMAPSWPVVHSFSLLCSPSSLGFCSRAGRLNGWVLFGLAQWTRPWSCGLTGWACQSSAVEVEVNSGITVLTGALTMH